MFNKNYEILLCFYDSDSDEFIISKVENISDYATNNYTPIGVVAVPSSHTDNHRPRLVSLVHMSCDTPGSGTTKDEIKIHWGGFEFEVSGLDKKSTFPYISEVASGVTIDGIVKFEYGLLGGFYLPSDSNGENNLNDFIYENPSNSNEHFYYDRNFDYDRQNYFMCSPYKQDGSKDERYFDSSNTANSLADFDGKSNTDIILAMDNSYDTSWQTENTINNTSDNEYIHPAAQCCWRFHTVGTNQGDWYLPSAGEMGYVVARMQTIQNSLKALLDERYTASLLFAKNWYCSSTQFSYETNINLHFDTGLIGYVGKGNVNFVRAFLKL